MWIRSISAAPWAAEDDPKIAGSKIVGRLRLTLGSGRIVPALLLERSTDGRRQYLALYLVQERGTYETQPVEDLRGLL
jgi:hypothetical protein